jgi:lipid-binding SYLF domain-containing protein
MELDGFHTTTQPQDESEHLLSRVSTSSIDKEVPHRCFMSQLAGGELMDLIIVLRTNDAIKTFGGDAHLSIGAGLSAAVGIVGRVVEADVRAGDGGYAACYTYSCSKGAFVGCSLEGSIVTTRTRENSRFYGNQAINASDILLGSLPRPPAAAILYRALGDLYQKLDK